MRFNHLLVSYLCCYFVTFDNVTLLVIFFYYKEDKENLNSYIVYLSRFFDSIDVSTISSDILSGKAGLRCTLKSAAQAFLYV